MANTTTPLLDTILARGLKALRENAVLPRLVNSGYDVNPGTKGSTVTIPIPAAVSATSVTPGPTPPANADLTATSVTLTLDQWYYAPFYLSDKDVAEISDRVDWMPAQASEAIKVLANKVDVSLASLYPNVYGYGGTAGTTPFASDASAFLAARKALVNQLAPIGNNEPYFCVINGDAEYNALGLRVFQDAAMRGQAGALQTGQIGNAFGYQWYVDQNLQTQTNGAATHWWVNDAGNALVVGDTEISVETDGGATGHLHVGDIITFAGDTQTYAVTARTGGDAHTAITIKPGLKLDPGNHAAITVKDSHVVNLAFHRDAFALASRQLSAVQIPGMPNMSNGQTIVDPVTNLALRLQIIRGWMETICVFDILWGVALVRPEYAARIAG